MSAPGFATALWCINLAVSQTKSTRASLARSRLEAAHWEFTSDCRAYRQTWTNYMTQRDDNGSGTDEHIRGQNRLGKKTTSSRVQQSWNSITVNLNNFNPGVAPSMD